MTDHRDGETCGSKRQRQIKQKQEERSFQSLGVFPARGLENQTGISPVQVGEFKHAAVSESLRSRVSAIISLFVIPASAQTSARRFSLTAVLNLH